ncbi:hypothetical protein [Kibdelosporangium aridum]|uniref:hypothetical protein n=1 Tax=Kibdelosporangium aridum TaxID=2030 RepID=UPI00190E9CE6|nr:hypothetical protein [Kibdelosporangium aridum]
MAELVETLFGGGVQIGLDDVGVVPSARPAQSYGEAWNNTPGRGLSVDVELVALRVLHPDRVVIKPFVGQGAGDGGTEAS